MGGGLEACGRRPLLRELWVPEDGAGGRELACYGERRGRGRD